MVESFSGSVRRQILDRPHANSLFCLSPHTHTHFVILFLLLVKDGGRERKTGDMVERKKKKQTE